MDRLEQSGVYGPDIEVDLCHACHLLWLDEHESLQLSPRGTLDLFRVMHEHGDDARHALGSRQGCPRCGRRLSLFRDIGKGGRFSYYSCPDRHGRLTPFSEFLKEKQFVRALSPLEQQRLRAEVKVVQCSSCGAPVDLALGFQCAHCRAPITVLDADAVERTLRSLADADARRSGDSGDKEARARALAAVETMRARPEDRWEGALARRVRGGFALDLLSTSIAILFGER